MAQKVGRRDALKYSLGAVLGAVVGAGATGIYVSSSRPAAEQVKYLSDQNTLILGLDTSALDCLDPACGFSFQSFFIDAQIYTGLLKPVYPTFKDFIPDIASNLSISSDGLTYTATITSGLKFNNGDPITAKDFEYSWKRAINEKKPGWYWYQIADIQDPNNVQAVNDTTFQFKLGSPKSPSLVKACLNAPCFAVLNQKQTEANNVNGDHGLAWLDSNSAGISPFTLTEWTKQTQITLKANPNFWRDPKPAFQTVILKHIPQPATQLSLLQTGQIDVMWDPTADIVHESQFKPGYRTEGSPDLAVSWIWMNAKIKPFDDPNVWEAVKWSIDYDGIINGVLLGQAIPLQNLIPQGLIGYNPALPFRKDPATAKQFLAKAGYANGFSTELTNISGAEPDTSIATKVASDLADSGIQVRLVNRPVSEFFDLAVKGQVSMAIARWGGGLAHAENYVHGWLDYDAKSIANWFGWNDPKAIQLAQQSNTATSDSDLIKIYAQITDYTFHNAPFIVPCQIVKSCVHRDYVQNLILPYLYLYTNLAYSYKQKVVA